MASRPAARAAQDGGAAEHSARASRAPRPAALSRFRNVSESARCVFLERRVAKVDAAAQGARLSGRAAPVRILPRARLARVEMSRRPRRLVDQKDSFRRGQKERVAILVKPAAAARKLRRSGFRSETAWSTSW